MKISPPKLKVCGLTQADQIQELIDFDVDYLGFIFYEKSPRFALNRLSFEEISQFKHQGKTGVFVNEKPEKVLDTVEKAGLNFLQLHGDETAEEIIELRKQLPSEIKIIKAIRIGTQSIIEMEKKILETSKIVDYLLFDTDSSAFGGTGKSFDWRILNELKLTKPYFLSGGISEENISNLNVLENRPFALDINSKFELEPGNKNIEQIRSFSQLLKNTNNDKI